MGHSNNKTTAISATPTALWVNLPDNYPNEYNRDLVEALITEIALRSNSAPVNELHLSNPFDTLTGADITELMHCLSNRFQSLSDNAGTVEYCVEQSPYTLNHGQLALLKGLGFNQLMVSISSDMPPEQFSALSGGPLKAARDLKYHRVGLTIYFDPHNLDQTLWSALVEQLQHLPVDRVRLCPNLRPAKEFLFTEGQSLDTDDPESLIKQWGQWASYTEQMKSLYASLLPFGMEPVGWDHIVTTDDPLKQALDRKTLNINPLGITNSGASEVVGIGPGAYQYRHLWQSANETRPEQYISQLKQLKLPDTREGRWCPRREIPLYITLQLLCYLEVDLSDTLRNHPQILDKIHRAIVTVKTLSEGADWLELHQHNLKVPEQHRHYLAPICDLLYSQLTAGV